MDIKKMLNKNWWINILGFFVVAQLVIQLVDWVTSHLVQIAITSAVIASCYFLITNLYEKISSGGKKKGSKSKWID